MFKQHQAQRSRRGEFSTALLVVAVLVVVFFSALSVQGQTTTTTAAATTTTTLNGTNMTSNSTNSTSNVTSSPTTTNATANTTEAPSNATGNTTTAAPTTPAPEPFIPAGPGPIDVRPIRNVSCPFSRWQGDPRYCYECRWCPFRSSTCCEMEDEIAVLKSVNVSGSTDWDCFITIVHFQQCGRCDPNSIKYLMNTTPPLNYVWDPRNVAIRPCKQSCKYIWKQCKDALTLAGEYVVPPGQDEVEFCKKYPAVSTEEIPCFDSAGHISAVIAMLVSAVVLIVTFVL